MWRHFYGCTGNVKNILIGRRDKTIYCFLSLEDNSLQRRRRSRGIDE
jgi:hypothetical protein